MTTETLALRFPAETHVTIYPFTRQVERDGVVIGRPDTGTFLSLPIEALGVLEDLAAGMTVGQAQEAYFQRHGETPEMDEFLGILEAKGLLWQGSQGPREPQTGTTSPRTIRYHFSNVSETFARRLFGPAAMAVYAASFTLALIAVWHAPSIVPGRDAFYFAEHRTLKAVAFALFVYATLFVHELSHLLAARAVGVSSRMGISHRLWYLVAETDLTGLWALPKRQRYLPLLAGPLSDVVSASLLLLLLFLHEQSALVLQRDVLDLVQAGCFMYFMRLLWQTFLFVRTDFYFVISTFLDCKNLLKDTEAFLKSRVASVLHRGQPVDQSQIPAHEQRIIRGYVLVWLAGRGMAFLALFLVSIPLLWHYTVELGSTLRAGFATQPGAFLDALVLGVIFVVPIATGFYLWIRSLTQRWRSAV